MRFLSPHRKLLLSSLCFCLWSAHSSSCAAADTYRIVHIYPHDPQAFTQGLIYLDGHLYESTGLNGRSTLRMDDLETGRVLQSLPICLHNTSPKGSPSGAARSSSSPGRRTSASSTTASAFASCAPSHYSGEGWGLTHDAKNLILSDGTATLRFLDPKTFSEVRHIVVNGPRLSGDATQRA